MKRNAVTTILAVDPGTRYTGIAVLDGSELIDWGIKVANGKWSDAKLKKTTGLISKLICEYRPGVIALKRNHPSRSSRNLELLRQSIKHLARDKYVKVLEYSVEDLKVWYGQGTKITRQRIAEIVCLRYSVLARELAKEMAAGSPYHMRTFEAVALGCMAATETKR